MKDIPSWEGVYALTKDGRIKSYDSYITGRNGKLQFFRKGKWLKVSTHYKGYLTYHLVRGKRRKTIFAHRLVATTYLPNPLNLKEVNHKNGVKTDNHVENLEWCSRLQNMQHANRNGLVNYLKGSKHGNAKLTEDMVRDIRSIYDTEKPKQRDLAKRFGINQGNVWCIVHRKAWKHVK